MTTVRRFGNVQTREAGKMQAGKPGERKLRTGKLQMEEAHNGGRQSEKANTKSMCARKRHEEKIIVLCYILWAALMCLFTGLLSLCLVAGGVLQGESGKDVIETVSSLLGSIYVVFILGRFKEKEWKRKRELKKIISGLAYGAVLFVSRMISRAVFYLFPEGTKGTGFFTALMIDLICIILLYSQLPGGRKEGEGHV